MNSQPQSCFATVHGSRWLPSARVSWPWRGYSRPAAAGSRSPGALQVGVVGTKFFRALRHLIRDRCCTSLLRPPPLITQKELEKLDRDLKILESAHIRRVLQGLPPIT